MPPVVTYTTFVLHALLPATGWQGVYALPSGEHTTRPLYALALVTRRERERFSGELQTGYGPNGTEAEYREVVGLDFDVNIGFAVCDEQNNYCGLLPPDWSLLQYEQQRDCRHSNTPEGAPECASP